MRLILLIVFTQMSFMSMAQDKIIFEYDQSGNQIVRRYCPSCSESKHSNDSLDEENLLKFFPEDVISYYPNPVKEELYIKWELINDNVVNEIQLFDVSGKILTTINGLDKVNHTNLQFSKLPANIYLILMVYKDGNVKSIKIVKE